MGLLMTSANVKEGETQQERSNFISSFVWPSDTFCSPKSQPPHPCKFPASYHRLTTTQAQTQGHTSSSVRLPSQPKLSRISPHRKLEGGRTLPGSLRDPRGGVGGRGWQPPPPSASAEGQDVGDGRRPGCWGCRSAPPTCSWEPDPRACGRRRPHGGGGGQLALPAPCPSQSLVSFTAIPQGAWRCRSPRSPRPPVTGVHLGKRGSRSQTGSQASSTPRKGRNPHPDLA